MARDTLFRPLLGQLESWIGTLEAGSILPAEQQLAERFCVSRPTLRRALAELVERRIISTRNGVGSVVLCPSLVIPRELFFLCRDLVFFSETLREFSRTAISAGYLPVILPLEGGADAQKRIIATVLERKPAGIVFYPDPTVAPESCSMLRNSQSPLLFLVRIPEGLTGNLLTFENYDGIPAILRDFYRQSCRKFAVFGYGMDNPIAARERTAAFLDGLHKCRLRLKANRYCPPDATPEQLEAFFNEFKKPDKAPDAVCCLNDYCACSFLVMMKSRGLDTSRLRISGFDHLRIADFLPRSITTVEPPLEELGREAASMLIRQIENPSFGFLSRKLSSRLVETQPVF